MAWHVAAVPQRALAGVRVEVQVRQLQAQIQVERGWICSVGTVRTTWIVLVESPPYPDVVLERAVAGLRRQMSELSSVLDDEVAEERGRAFAEHMSVATFVPVGGGRGF